LTRNIEATRSASDAATSSLLSSTVIFTDT
jgi:hypothetical protein